MYRREFLAFASTLLFPAFTAAARQPSGLQPAPVSSLQLRAELLHYTRSLSTNHAIGNAWLATGPARPSPEQLLDTLTAKLSDTHDGTALAAHSDMRERIALQVRRDFQAGDIVALNGWILSQTETQLCGLARLLTEHATLS